MYGSLQRLYSLDLKGWHKDWEDRLVIWSGVTVIGFLYNGVWFGSLGKVRSTLHTLL